MTRTGDETATSAYGYTYGIDFVGTEVRGDMDLRYALTRMPATLSRVCSLHSVDGLRARKCDRQLGQGLRDIFLKIFRVFNN